MAKKITKLPDNAPTAQEFSAGGYQQVPPGGRENWEHEFYSKDCSFVRFKHKETGETVVCPNMWYNGTPQSSIDRRLFWIEQGKEREKYWESQPDHHESREHLKKIREDRVGHLAAIEHIKKTGEVI